MKTFIIRVAAFIGVGLLLAGVLYVPFYLWYFHQRVPIRQQQIIARSAPSEVSLVLGSSHSFFAIDARYLGADCFNHSSPSQTIYEDYLILRSVASTRKVGFIILPFSYFSNFTKLGKAIEGERIRMFDYEKACHASYVHDRDYYRAAWMAAVEIAHFGTMVDFHKILLDERGDFDRPCTSASHTLADSLEAFQRHSICLDFSSRNPYYDSIFQFCAKRGIKVNLIVFPFATGYKNQIQQGDPGFERMVTYFRELKMENYRFLDYRDFIKTNEPYYFENADHLSACSMDTFSKVLSTSILR